MKKVILVATILLLTLLVVVGCAQPAAPIETTKTVTTTVTAGAGAPVTTTVTAAAKTVTTTVTAAPTLPSPSTGKHTLTFAFGYGTSTTLLAFSNPDYRFQRMVEAASGGRLIIDSQMDVIKDTEVAIAVSEGRFDMGRFYPPWVSGTFPLWDFSDIPFFFGSIYDYERAVKDPRLVSLLDKSYRESGLVLLADLTGQGSSEVWSMEPITTVADFKDLKVRASGLLPSYGWELLGAKPMSISGSEMAELLRRGTVDAMHSDRTWPVTIGVAEVAKYLGSWEIIPVFSTALVVNQDKFDSLPPDLQQVLRDVSKQLRGEIAYAATFGKMFALKVIEGYGVEILTIDKAEIAKAREITAESSIAKFIEITGTEGADLIAIISDYARE